MTAKTATENDFRMSGKEFDRIMGKALQVKPETAKKTKTVKSKAASKKARKK